MFLALNMVPGVSISTLLPVQHKEEGTMGSPWKGATPNPFVRKVPEEAAKEQQKNALALKM